MVEGSGDGRFGDQEIRDDDQKKTINIKSILKTNRRELDKN